MTDPDSPKALILAALHAKRQSLAEQDTALALLIQGVERDVIPIPDALAAIR